MFKKFLTFVVPAPHGCNLRCPFCIIRQRNEVEGVNLQPHEFVQFIKEARERETIHVLSIQGYEPLLPDSVAYTRAILEAGLTFDIPVNFVTNGVYLGAALDLLTVHKPNAIAISLDSHVAEIHDRIRGVPGTWHAVVDGLSQAVKRLGTDTHVVVSSVLFPSKVENLLGMPALLADVGVGQWLVNPVTAISDRRGKRPVEQDVEILRAGLKLQNEADKYGIRFAVDDDLSCLDQAGAVEAHPELADVFIHTPDDDLELFRLTPSGQCSVGRDILSPITPDVPRWTPNAMHAADFLSALPRPANGPRISRSYCDNRQSTQ